MNITLAVPTMLRHECGGRDGLQVPDVAAVDDILRWLESHQPALYRNFCDDSGHIRQHINVFLNDDLLHKKRARDTVVSDGDTISILPAVSGG